MINNKFVSPILMWAIILFGIIIIFNVVSRQRIFATNTITSILVISAVVYWLYFFLRALSIHRQAIVSVAKIDKIVKEGVYSLVRHPIYVADIVLAWGIFLFLPQERILTSTIWLTLVIFFWMRLEERALTEKFGEEYTGYEKQVPMVFPKVFKK